MSDARRAFDSKKKKSKARRPAGFTTNRPPQTLSTFWVEEMFAQGSSKVSKRTINAIRVPFAIGDCPLIKSLER
ncbi:MAG: hypothetical protein DWI14_01280 [Planctomycetota bacterium]|nr:MAG: hypothetical protein DWI14_01280 [Planctomycetota bacterium]